MPSYLTKEYWDTCLFIAYLKDSEDERPAVDVVDALLRKVQKEKDRLIVVSTYLLAELRGKESYDEHRYRIVKDLFYTNRSYIKVVALTPRLADLASAIGGDHQNISTMDCVHLATALSEKVTWGKMEIMDTKVG